MQRDLWVRRHHQDLSAVARCFSISPIECFVRSLLISAIMQAFPSEWNALRNSASVFGGATTMSAFASLVRTIYSMAVATVRANRGSSISCQSHFRCWPRQPRLSVLLSLKRSAERVQVLLRQVIDGL